MADLTVYYDGACPLCRAEIALYQGRTSAEFVDVSDPDNVPLDLDAREAMARFHVRDNGRLRSGARAFAALWRSTPGWQTIGRITSLPVVSSGAELAYRAFLVVRPLLQRIVRRRSSLQPSCRSAGSAGGLRTRL